MLTYSNQVPQSIQQTKKQTQMESQQDIVDLTINDDDDCSFLTEPSEMANSLKMNGMEGNKETAKQNHEDVSVCGSEDGESVYGSEDGEITAKQNQEDDTLSVYGSEDGEIVTDKEKEKEEESKKIIFKRIWSNFGKKSQEKQCPNLLHSMFTHAAIKLSIQGKWKGSVWDSK